MKNKLYLLLLFTSTSVLCYGQTPAPAERVLLQHFQRIGYWQEHQEMNYDSLGKANDAFLRRLLAFPRRDPSTLGQPFSSLVREGLLVATSPDGRFRMYSWDTGLGGTLRDY